MAWRQVRARQVRDVGLRRVVEFADANVATLLGRDRSLRSLCVPLRDRHLMSDPTGEPQVRRALRKLGHPLGPAKG